MRVFIIQAVQCVICVYYSNCIVPSSRVGRNILNLTIREVKSSFFNSPSSSYLTVSFVCMEGMSTYVTAEEVMCYMF